jgi:hypothetical protein
METRKGLCQAHTNRAVMSAGNISNRYIVFCGSGFLWVMHRKRCRSLLPIRDE